MQQKDKQNAGVSQFQSTKESIHKNYYVTNSPNSYHDKSQFQREDQIFWLLKEKIQNELDWQHEQFLFHKEQQGDLLSNSQHQFLEIEAIKSEDNYQSLQIFISEQQSEYKNVLKTPDFFGIAGDLSPVKLSLQFSESNQIKDKKQIDFKCSCKKSKCLKLYCECFRSGRECNNCGCLDCKNNSEAHAQKNEAIQRAQEKDPNIFTQSKYKGCRCNKSKCLKKYCECFMNGHMCGKYCKCTGCQNCNKKGSHYHRN